MTSFRQGDVEESLRALLAVTESRYLPPVRELRSRLRTGQAALTRALKSLEAAGFLAIAPRQRIRILRAEDPGSLRWSAPSEVPEADGLGTSVPVGERIHASLRRRIERGEWRHSEPVPKSATLCAEEGVSMVTLRKALRRLVAEGFLTRHGKRWFAGALRNTAVRGGILTRPMVAVLLPRSTFWQALGKSERYAPFLHTFARELERRSIILNPLVLTASSGDFPITGLDEVLTQARKLGGRYLGSLLLGSRSEIPDFPRWCAGLSSLGRKAVWFDRYDEGFLDAMENRITRCHFSETQGITASLAALSALGHREIGYIAPTVDTDWSRRRLALLMDHAARRFPLLRIRSIEQGEWDAAVLNGSLDSLFRRLYGSNLPIRAHLDRFLDGWPDYAGVHRDALDAQLSGIPKTARFERLIALFRFYHVHTKNSLPIGPEIYFTPRIGTLLHRYPAITAFLSANDANALKILAWSRAVGLHIPGDFSLLSFDNAEATRIWPISSIDFGFETLGYHAAHTLLDDIPLPRDKAGNIPSQAGLVERGSLGKLRRGGFSLPG